MVAELLHNAEFINIKLPKGIYAELCTRHSAYCSVIKERTRSKNLVEGVLKLRDEYPRWSKDKLAILLHKESYQVSSSVVGRIIHGLKDCGVLREANKKSCLSSPAWLKQPHAVRKPKDYEVTQRGDLVQLYTLDTRRLPGVVIKRFV